MHRQPSKRFLLSLNLPPTPTSWRDEFRSLIFLAIPLALAQLAQNSLGFIDTVMVGRLGDEALSGIAIGSAMFHFVGMIVSGILYAVSPMIAHQIGAGKKDNLTATVQQGFWIAILAFIPVVIVFWNAAPILRLLGQQDHVVEMSSGYLKAVSFGILPMLLLVALRGFLEGLSHARPVLWICAAGVVMNVFLNDALMFGRWGLPALGLVGTGIATSLVYTLMFLFGVIYVWKFQTDYPVFSSFPRMDLPLFRELLVLGLPIALTIGFEGGMFTFATFMMGVIDDQQLAAHQVALQAASISFMIPLGIAIATCVRVGRWAGAEDLLSAKRAGQVGMLTALGVMTIGAVLFGFFPKVVLGLFFDLSDPDYETVARYGVTFLQIAALFQFVDGLQVAASQSLRGLKKTREAMFLTLVAYWGIGVPACLILGFTCGLEGRGLWYGLILGLAAAAIMLTWRFHWEFRRGRE